MQKLLTFFQQKIYIGNVQILTFEILTNDVVSFEQPGPGSLVPVLYFYHLNGASIFISDKCNPTCTFTLLLYVYGNTLVLGLIDTCIDTI